MDCRPARRALVRPQLDRVRPERKRTRYPRRWRWRPVLARGLHQLSGAAAGCPLSRRDTTVHERPAFRRCRARSLARDPLQSKKVARVQIHRALQVLQPSLLLAAPPQNVAGEFEETRTIG